MSHEMNSRAIATAIAFIVGIVVLLQAGSALAVPSFARQTGLACESCHTVFPELTPFGRAFKLNGYLIDNLPQVKGMTADNKEEALLLNQIPPLSVMVQASYTRTNKALPDLAAGSGDAQNGQVLLPQQASLFYAGRVAPKLGAFIQLTYDSEEGFGLDNTDIRFADQVKAFGQEMTWGLSLNNNPTVQDVWNSTPAWLTPFDQRSNAAPMPAAVTQIDGTLSGSVAGLTAYGNFPGSIYAEGGFYWSAPQGQGGSAGAGPLDSTAADVVQGSAPYWRLAYEHQSGPYSWEVGTYGMDVKLLPGDGQVLSGAVNEYRDVAVDTQFQLFKDESIYSVQATYIDEKQTLDASFAAGNSSNESDTLKTWRVAGSYYYQRKYVASLGYFSTTGTTDPLLYPADSVYGSANGSPDSNGWTGELDYVPWENVKIALQYTAYNEFNGGSTNYDGSGRNASDNNTTYLLAWFNF